MKKKTITSIVVIIRNDVKIPLEKDATAANLPHWSFVLGVIGIVVALWSTLN